MSPEDVCNQALALIGPLRIGTLHEGSPQAVAAIELWSQTRDALLQKVNPDWARRDAVLVVSKTAPEYSSDVPWSASDPALPWKFEYLQPADCVDPLLIKPSYLSIPVYRPRAVPFRLTQAAPPTILCDLPNAILTYVAQVLSPDDMQRDFIAQLVTILAVAFQQKLAERQNANASG